MNKELKTYTAHIECGNDLFNAGGLLGYEWGKYNAAYHFDAREEAEKALQREIEKWSGAVYGYVHEHDHKDPSGNSVQRLDIVEQPTH